MMFCRERKIVCVGSEKIIILMWNLKILALLLMMRKITLLVKFDEKYLHRSYFICIYKCESGMLVEYQVRDPEDTGSRPACVV